MIKQIFYTFSVLFLYLLLFSGYTIAIKFLIAILMINSLIYAKANHTIITIK